MRNLISRYTNIPVWASCMIALFCCQCQSNDGKQAASPPKNEIPILSTSINSDLPDEWIDQDTGHRIIRLSRLENGGRSFYFHNNPFIPGKGEQADKMVFYSQVNSLSQLFVINLETLDIQQLTHHPNRIRGEIVAKNAREVIYQSNDSVYSTHIDSGKTRLRYVFPEDFKAGITTLNSDERLLAGSYSGEEKRKLYEKYPDKSSYFTIIYEAKLPHELFTVDMETGELNRIYKENAWLNHVQFSPTDPNLLMYCHEGPWHLVDRIWTIDISTGKTN